MDILMAPGPAGPVVGEGMSAGNQDTTLGQLGEGLEPPVLAQPQDMLQSVHQQLRERPNCAAALIIEGSCIRAVLSPRQIAKALARPFARELFYRWPLSRMLDVWPTPSLSLPAQTLIGEAVRLALGRSAEERYEPIAVTNDGQHWMALDIHVLLSAQCQILTTTQREREQLHQRLVDASRDAGRAEVATGVLHNVGNVLNSVNVSTGLMVSNLAQSRLPNLTKAMGLITQNQDNLPAFLGSDAKGKQLPGYLVKLADVLAQEHSVLSQELATISNSIEHIKQIVQMQQSYAKRGAVKEMLRPAQVFQDAERVNLVSFERHNVQVTYEFEEIGPVLLDKHRLLQILINLISNAKNAVKAKTGGEKRIIFKLQRACQAEQEIVRFVVIDNGVGIPAENMTRIFSHGFTTRAEGHGFGLHGAANAAKEMNGSLTVHSDGSGHGATFTLSVPIGSAAAAGATTEAADKEVSP